MTQVLIDRELLERAASMELDTTAHSIRIQDELRALLAQPAAPADGEAVEVVANVSTMGFGKHCAMGIGESINKLTPGDGLMTVAQHERILAAATRPADQVAESVAVPRELLENCADYMMGSASARVRIWHDQCRALLTSPDGSEEG